MKQFSKKVVTVKNLENDLQALPIYEVRAHRIKEDDRVTVDRFLSKKEAETEVEFCRDVHQNLYDSVWILEQLVWC